MSFPVSKFFDPFAVFFSFDNDAVMMIGRFGLGRLRQRSEILGMCGAGMHALSAACAVWKY
jgi:hypothetical protein